MLSVSMVSPERILFEGEADSVQLPGAKAPFTVLQGHASVVTLLEPGVITIRSSTGTETYVIDGGFAEVGNDKVTALVDRAYAPLEIQLDDEEAALAEVIARVESTETGINARQKDMKKHRTRIRIVKGI